MREERREQSRVGGSEGGGKKGHIDRQKHRQTDKEGRKSSIGLAKKMPRDPATCNQK